MILEIQNLTKNFESLTAVNNLSIKITSGEIYGLLGPNGCGKSTLIKNIIGLQKPDSGSINLFNNYQPGELRSRSKIGYMPQSPSVYEGLSVWENIFFFGKVFKMSSKEINQKTDELLEVLNLQDKRHALASHLSGGMLRRLSLASTLIHNPSLLLLDEPTAGVDPVLRLQFWDYFQKLVKSGTSIIITTHHISEASRCTKVGFMRKGSIFLEDSPEGIMKHYDVTNLEEAFVKSTDIEV